MRTPDAFGQIIVANVASYPVRIRDLGTVAIGAANERTVSRFNGKPSLTGDVLHLPKGLKLRRPHLWGVEYLLGLGGHHRVVDLRILLLEDF